MTRLQESISQKKKRLQYDSTPRASPRKSNGWKLIKCVSVYVSEQFLDRSGSCLESISRGCSRIENGSDRWTSKISKDLDDEYLIIWDGFTHLNWKNVGPGALRKFLVEWANEGPHRFSRKMHRFDAQKRAQGLQIRKSYRSRSQ